MAVSAQTCAEAAEAAFRRGDLGGAESWGRRAVSSDPGCTLGYLVLGILGARLGRPDAEEHLLRALELDENLPEALNGLAALALRAGKLEEAEAFAQRAIGLRPEDPEGFNNLGLAHLRRRQSVQAVAAFEAALTLEGGQAHILHNLGQAHLVAGNDHLAGKAFRAALDLEPHEPRSLLALVNILLGHALVDEPVTLLREAVVRHPGSSALHLALAHALTAARDRAAARASFMQAVKLDPSAEVGFAFWLQEEGQFEEAATRLRRAIQVRPRQGQAYYGLLQGRKATEADRPLVAQMESLLSEGGLNARETSYLHYALGKAYDDLREFELAIRHFDGANAAAHTVHLAARPFDPEAQRAANDRTMERLDRETIARLAETGSPTRRPILIVGMIRSGTSLLEQIVASHPQVAPAGELRYWLEESPLALELDTVPVRSLGERYDEYLQAIAPVSPRVTDKMPLNYAFVGLIAAALPNAPILHIRRNPVDTCLSIYATPYASPPDWAYDPEAIVANYREYQRLMEYWRAVLPPGRMLEIDYEALVEDREAVLRRVLDFCGLPWDAAVLAHEKSSQSVGTPSLWQVRQPIYRTSMARWRNFEPWLGAFADLQPELSIS